MPGAADNMAGVEVQHLTKCFARRRAVDDLSFSVGVGEIVGLLGPNGAGKTTTMRMLAGSLHPSCGTVLIDGLDVRTDPIEGRRRIGYMPESVPLYPEMRVRDYLLFFARLRGLPYTMSRDRIQAVMQLCGIEAEAGRIAGRLSRGYRQRLGLAASLLHDPRVLILDEPTLGLDPNQVRELRAAIRHLRDGRAILLSTHVLSEAESICDRVLIMKAGRLLASDTTANLLARGAGGYTVTAEIGASPDAVEAACREIEGVVGADAEALDGPWCRLSLACATDADVRSEVFSLCARRGWVLRDLRRERHTLEEAFAAITGAEGGEA